MAWGRGSALTATAPDSGSSPRQRARWRQHRGVFPTWICPDSSKQQLRHSPGLRFHLIKPIQLTLPFFLLSRNPQQCSVYAKGKNLFSASVQPEWAKDMPNLRALHLTKMSRLRSLDTDLRFMPHLRELNCDDSHSLGFVRTEMFESTPHLSHLSFQK